MRLVAHQHQSALRKGNIDETRRRGERQSPSNLVYEEKRSQCLYLIQQKGGPKKAEELIAHVLHIEANRRKQVQPHRYADGRRDNQHDEGPAREEENLFENIAGNREAR